MMNIRGILLTAALTLEAGVAYGGDDMLIYTVNNQLQLSWPDDHTGWQL